MTPLAHSGWTALDKPPAAYVYRYRAVVSRQLSFVAALDAFTSPLVGGVSHLLFLGVHRPERHGGRAATTDDLVTQVLPLRLPDDEARAVLAADPADLTRAYPGLWASLLDNYRYAGGWRRSGS